MYEYSKYQASLDRVGRGMSGSDVIIDPNILEQMATDSEKATYYENKIDNYFNTVIPRDTLAFASKGLVYDLQLFLFSLHYISERQSSFQWIS